MEQKIIITKAEDAANINSLLKEGWEVKNMIAEHVAVATGSGYHVSDRRGFIIFLLQREYNNENYGLK